ncbi:MAG: BatA domain-containing protein, partial [Planctomyces sp.]
MFEFLAQNFAVAGGVLAAIPLLLHMLRRTPAVRMPFSLVRFLSPTLPKTTRRSRIENWPLMLLRILAVALIALAFSRPFQRIAVTQDSAAPAGRRSAILLDSSASMRRDGIAESLLLQFREQTAALQPADILSVSSFAQTTRTLLTADEWRQTDPASRTALLQRVEQQWQPDWTATHLDSAMLEAAEEVSRERLGESSDAASVIVITDFQEGSRLDALRSSAWPDGVRLELRPVKPEQSGNRGLSLAEDQKSGRVRVRVTASGDAPSGACTLQPFDSQGKPVGNPIPLDIAPGQRRTAAMPEVTENQPQIAGVELLGDPHPFDNVVDLPLQQQKTRRILHAGSTDANDEESMRYYLQRVFDGQEAEPLELLDLVTADGMPIPPPADSKLVMLTDTIPASLAPTLKQIADQGGIILAAIKSAEMASSISSLLPAGLQWTEAEVKDYAIMTATNSESQLLAPFADARFSDFSSIRFWHYRRIEGLPQDNSVQILARFDSGSPAILEIRTPSGGRIF